MTLSTLDVWNSALSACRAKGSLSSLDEASFEREVCERWYPSVLATVQEAVWWDSCSVTQRLPLLATRDFTLDWANGDPEPPYTYMYSLPTDYLRARQLSHGQPFNMGFSETHSRRVLHTNAQNAVFSYSRKEADPTRWSAGQQMATIYGLAAHIAFEITGRNSIVEKNISLANKILTDAQTTNANNSNEPEQAMAPWHVARGAASLEVLPTYTYPLGQVFSTPEVNI